MPTKGPGSDPGQVISFGRACHIHAAAKGGPRFDPTQTPEQRRSAENGIWLCALHAGEVDDDRSMFSAEELRRWRGVAESWARARLGHAGSDAGEQLIALGPELIAQGRVIHSAPNTRVLELRRFLLGGVETLHRYSDWFSELSEEERFVCFRADGVGRTICGGPRLETAAMTVVELEVAPVLPRSVAREQHDARLRGVDLAMDLSGEAPDLDPAFREISGVETLAQSLCVHLSTPADGYTIGCQHGSRVAELLLKLGETWLEDIVALETIRLATVPLEDEPLGKPTIPFDFVERVRGVRRVSGATGGFVKFAITLDIYGLGESQEFIVPVSTAAPQQPALPPSAEFAASLADRVAALAKCR